MSECYFVVHVHDHWEIIIPVLLAIEVLFFSTFISLRANFYNNASIADVTGYSHLLQSISDINVINVASNRKNAEKWFKKADDFRIGVISRTISVWFCAISLLLLIPSLLIILISVRPCWFTLFWLSLTFLFFALLNLSLNVFCKKYNDWISGLLECISIKKCGKKLIWFFQLELKRDTEIQQLIKNRMWFYNSRKKK